MPSKHCGSLIANILGVIWNYS